MEETVVERKKSGDAAVEEDRLSNLPDDILQHILSFLETKHAIQTSILSKIWKSRWKHLLVLKINAESFDFLPSFENFVSSVLHNRRPGPTIESAVTKLELRCVASFTASVLTTSIVDKVVQYAVDHRIEHLIFETLFFCKGFTLNALTYPALKTLELVCFELYEPFPFPTITTMRFRNCMFSIGPLSGLDLFAGCHSLKNLSLIDCRIFTLDDIADAVFKITAPQLINLTIRSDVLGCQLQIFAPKLEYFGSNWHQAYKSGDVPLYCSVSLVKTLDNRGGGGFVKISY